MTILESDPRDWRDQYHQGEKRSLSYSGSCLRRNWRPAEDRRVTAHLPAWCLVAGIIVHAGFRVADRQLLDAPVLGGHLIPAASMLAFFGRAPGEVFRMRITAPVFPSGMGRAVDADETDGSGSGPNGTSSRASLGPCSWGLCGCLQSRGPHDVRIAIVRDNFSPHATQPASPAPRGRWQTMSRSPTCRKFRPGNPGSRRSSPFCVTSRQRDHGRHEDQVSMIRRFMIWRNSHPRSTTPSGRYPGKHSLTRY